MWKLNNTLLNNYGLKSRILKMKTSKNENVIPNYEMCEISGLKGEMYGYIGLLHETKH